MAHFDEVIFRRPVARHHAAVIVSARGCDGSIECSLRDAGYHPFAFAKQRFPPVNLGRDTKMMSSWWLWWMVFMLLFLVSPIGYGWGYRNWGPPYPRYLQRRRARLAGPGGSTTFDHHAWGYGGDFVWVIALVGICWVAAAFWWR